MQLFLKCMLWWREKFFLLLYRPVVQITFLLFTFLESFNSKKKGFSFKHLWTWISTNICTRPTNTTITTISTSSYWWFTRKQNFANCNIGVKTFEAETVLYQCINVFISLLNEVHSLTQCQQEYSIYKLTLTLSKFCWDAERRPEPSGSWLELGAEALGLDLLVLEQQQHARSRSSLHSI